MASPSASSSATSSASMFMPRRARGSSRLEPLQHGLPFVRRDGRDREPVAALQDAHRGQLGIGGGIGFLSGLVGAGGAFVSVPIMVWCNVPIHNAMATSAALGFPIALFNTVGYVIGGWALAPALPGAFGYLYLPALALLATGTVVAAPWGARTAHRMDTRQLRRAFAVLLYGLAAYMAWGAVKG